MNWGVIVLPDSDAPYKRTYKSSKSKGKQNRIRCSKCGKTVPKWKTVPVKQKTGFGGRVPKEVWNQMTRAAKAVAKRKRYRVIRVCPKCAKHYGYFKVGISPTKKGKGKNRGSMRYGRRRH